MTYMRSFLILLTVLATYGCAAFTPPARGLNKTDVEPLLLKHAGLIRPPGINIKPMYKTEHVVDTVSTRFLCNGKPTLSNNALSVLTKHEANYVEFSISAARECASSLSQYKLVGKYNKDYMYLTNPTDSEPYVYVFRILASGNKLRHAGNFANRSGSIAFIDQNHYYESEFEIWNATDDAESALGVLRDNISLHGRNENKNEDRGPSTASQLLQFSNLVAQNYAASNAQRNAAAASAKQSGLLASSQRAADDARAATERRAAEATQKSLIEAKQSRERLAQADARDRENQRRIETERAAEQQREEQRRNKELERRQAQARQEQQQTQEREQKIARQKEQDQKKAEAAKLAEKKIPESKIVVGEGGSDYCYAREIAANLATIAAKNDAHDECSALGPTWRYDKVKFEGYLGCTPCGGGEKGNFKCKVTQATYNCVSR